MIISIIDSNLHYWHQDGKILIVMLYIDDLIIIGNFEEKIDWLKEQLARGFNMMDLGSLGCYQALTS
jgi:hypothetical protein